MQPAPPKRGGWRGARVGALPMRLRPFAPVATRLDAWLAGWQAGFGRTLALEGEIGQCVRCAIYERRPGPCRDFAPYAPLGIGDDACDRARRRHGLAPLAL